MAPALPWVVGAWASPLGAPPLPSPTPLWRRDPRQDELLELQLKLGGVLPELTDADIDE